MKLNSIVLYVFILGQHCLCTVFEVSFSQKSITRFWHEMENVIENFNKEAFDQHGKIKQPSHLNSMMAQENFSQSTVEKFAKMDPSSGLAAAFVKIQWNILQIDELKSHTSINLFLLRALFELFTSFIFAREHAQRHNSTQKTDSSSSSLGQSSSYAHQSKSGGKKENNAEILREKIAVNIKVLHELVNNHNLNNLFKQFETAVKFNVNIVGYGGDSKMYIDNLVNKTSYEVVVKDEHKKQADVVVKPKQTRNVGMPLPAAVIVQGLNERFTFNDDGDWRLHIVGCEIEGDRCIDIVWRDEVNTVFGGSYDVHIRERANGQLLLQLDYDGFFTDDFEFLFTGYPRKK